MSYLVLRDFTGGLNDTIPYDSLRPNELIRADNILVFKTGGAEVRPGTLKFNSTSYAAEVDQDISYYLSDGSFIHLVMVGNILYKVNNSTGALTSKKALARATIGYFVYENKLFFVDGNDYYVYGYFKFTSASGTQTIALNDVVKNIASSGGGTANHFYKAKAAHGSTNLGTENYANTSKWDDITDGSIPDDIRSVPADGKGTVSGNDLSNIKRCTILEYHPHSYRVFAAGDSTDPTALYYTEIDNPYAHVPASVLRPKSGAGPITALKSFVNSMLISYKRLWKYWDGIEVGTDAQFGDVPIPTGCINNWAVAMTPYSLTFWGADGPYVIYPGILIKDLTVMATNEMYQRLDEGKVEAAVKTMLNPDKVRIVYHDGNVYFAYGTTTGRNDSVLVMNWDTKTFVKYTGWQVNDWHISSTEELWFATKNYILKQSSTAYSDINTSTGAKKAIDVKMYLPPLNLGDIRTSFLKKYLKNLFIMARQFETSSFTSDMTATIVSDYQETTASFSAFESLVWGTRWGLAYGFVDLVIKRMDCAKKAFRHSLQLESNIVDNHWFLYTLGYEYTALEDSEATSVNINLTPWITD